MVFNSAVFLFVFFPAVFLLARLVPGTRGKNLLLCAASLLFYAFGRPAQLLVLLGSAVGNWLLGRLLGRAGSRRKLLCTLGVGLNLALLGAFKYLDFSTGVLNAALGLDLPPLGLPLPAGVSFFTFQAISYLVDVTREPDTALRRFDSLLLYLAFFPRLLSGPLLRCADAQLAERRCTAEDTSAGLRRFVLGLAKKLLIADIVGSVADGVFALSPAALTAPLAWLGALSYTLQLYFDFSGYSDMAIGLGRVFGFHFPENFNYPYIARSLTEFWRRWHITLSRWFRDYVYIPLGGNRRGRARTAFNKLCVFLLTGLWHGAGWTFLLWGLWHGAFMMLESAAKPFFRRLERSRAGRLALWLYTMLVVVLGFVLFRSASLAEAWALVSQMFRFTALPETRAAAKLFWQTTLDSAHLLALLLAVLFSAPLLPRLRERLSAGGRGELLCDAGSLLLFALCLLALSGSGFAPFIYFQF